MSSRTEHLSGPEPFKKVLGGATIARSGHFSVHFAREEQLRIGALIPKRWAKRAVTRNAIRRQIYAWFECAVRSNSHPRPAVGWFVVRLRAGFGADVPACAKSLALTQAVRSELDAMTHKLGTADQASKSKGPKPASFAPTANQMNASGLENSPKLATSGVAAPFEAPFEARFAAPLDPCATS